MFDFFLHIFIKIFVNWINVVLNINFKIIISSQKLKTNQNYIYILYFCEHHSLLKLLILFKLNYILFKNFKNNYLI